MKILKRSNRLARDSSLGEIKDQSAEIRTPKPDAVRVARAGSISLVPANPAKPPKLPVLAKPILALAQVGNLDPKLRDLTKGPRADGTRQNECAVASDPPTAEVGTLGHGASTPASEILDATSSANGAELIPAVPPNSIGVLSTLACLVTAVRGIQASLEVIAEAMARPSRSTRQGHRTPGDPIDPDILARLAGKSLLTIDAVERLVGAKRSTIYGWIKENKFPAQVRVSAKASRWIEAEIETWLDTHKAARDDSSGSQQVA